MLFLMMVVVLVVQVETVLLLMEIDMLVVELMNIIKVYHLIKLHLKSIEKCIVNLV